MLPSVCFPLPARAGPRVPVGEVTSRLRPVPQTKLVPGSLGAFLPQAGHGVLWEGG